MFRKIIHVPAIVFVGAVLFIHLSCEKEFDEIGKSLLKDLDDVAFFEDSLTLSANMMEIPAFVSGDFASGISDTVYYLGYEENDTLGTIKAGIATSLLPVTAITNEGEPLTTALGYEHEVDSAFITIDVDSIFGQKSNIQNILCHEISNVMSDTNTYYSDFEKDINIVNPNFATLKSFEDNKITFTVSKSTAERLLDPAGDGSFYTDFYQEFIGGLFFEVESNPGSRTYIQTNMFAGATQLLIYYTSADSIFNYDKLVPEYKFSQKLFQFRFVLYDDINKTNAGIAVNTFTHDYSGYPVEDYLQDPPPDSGLFVHSFSKLAPVIEIEIPDQWKDSSNIAILQAELIVETDLSTDKDHRLKRLYLKQYKEDSLLTLYDSYLGDPDNNKLDGILNKNSYVFQITSHLQDILEKDGGENKLVVLPYILPYTKVQEPEYHAAYPPLETFLNGKMRLKVVYADLTKQ